MPSVIKYHPNRTHGLSKHPLYDIWRQIKNRCLNPYCIDYTNYGGRGIKLCFEWYSLTTFIHDIEKLLGPKPHKYSLDRVNNDGHYELTNVRWATQQTQSRNTRTVINLTFNGKTKCVIDWAEEYGINPFLIYDRIKLGWTGTDLLKPARKMNKKKL